MTRPVVRNAVQIGRVGELLAQAFFEENYKTARVNHEGFDLLVFDDDGEPYRVEVKAASQAHAKSYKFATATGSGSKKLLSPSKCDIVALVAIDLRRMVVKDVTELKHKRTSVATSRFLDVPETTQIRKAIARARERKNEQKTNRT